MQLYNVTLVNTGTGQQVYNENLPWRNKPTLDDICSFITFIRPSLKFDNIIFTFLRDLRENEI